MTVLKYDIIVIGGGPAGLAAAIAAKKAGCDSILILERDSEPGGILNQCIHNGFGLHTFHEELTGPEYAARYRQQAESLHIPCQLHTMAVDIEAPEEGGAKTVTALGRQKGMQRFEAKAVILAMGCRERARGALNIPGFRPAGIYSAGTAQRFVNMEGIMPGREVVILGSGDIGLIMARRMTLEGARVRAVAELMPYSGGLKRNIVQCLEDYGIPLKLSTTVVDIKGKERVEAVVLARVDACGRVIPGTGEEIHCDTLLLSCGLIPENELTGRLTCELSPVTGGAIVDNTYETCIDGVFSCGNVLHVHDLVDYVSEEAAMAGAYAAAYVRTGNGARTQEAMPIRAGSGARREAAVLIEAGDGVRYTVPALLRAASMEEKTAVKFRVREPLRDAFITVYVGGQQVYRQRKRVLAPGEMEQVTLRRSWFAGAAACGSVKICVEKD